MTHQEKILQKAIEKAEKNGYRGFSLVDKEAIVYIPHAQLWQYKKSPYNVYVSLYTIIFSHYFAKAFFGEGFTCQVHDHPRLPTNNNCDHIPAWQYHLQQMVILEDPILYLERFI